MAIKPELYYSLYDLHFPEYEPDVVRCMWQVMEEYPAAGFIFGGDQRDNKMISPHTKDEVEAQAESYFEDLEEFDKDILQSTEERLPRGAEKAWIIGNHSDWERQYVLKNPNMRGMESHLKLGLKKRGWKVIPCGEMFTKGNLNYMHGEWLTGQYHSRTALEVVCGNVVYGHFHTMQSHSKVLSYKRKQKWLAQSMPIGGKINPKWVRGRPNGWINGFGITEFHPNGNYNHYPVVVSDGICSWGGKIYRR